MADWKKKPTHRLRVMTRDEPPRKSNHIGAGWLNDNGSMSVQLDPGTVLSWKDDLVITLFPVKEDE